MNTLPITLLLADDDMDDCMFFREALEELPVSASLQTVNDGEKLMHRLTDKSIALPDILFLDLNMPLKTGIECLSEIKSIEKLKNLPIIIFSTSLNMEVVNALFDKGANYYIRKPGDFSALKKVIHKALTITNQHNSKQSCRDQFILQP